MREHPKEGCKSGSSLEQAPQSCGYGHMLLEFKKSLENALRKMVSILGGLIWSQGLGSMILVSPFQLRGFYDSMIQTVRRALKFFGIYIPAPQKNLQHYSAHAP